MAGTRSKTKRKGAEEEKERRQYWMQSRSTTEPHRGTTIPLKQTLRTSTLPTHTRVEKNGDLTKTNSAILFVLSAPLR